MENYDISKIDVEEEIRIVFMGTPEFSVPILEALTKEYNVRGIVTQPDKPVGRNKELIPSPIKKFANDNLILVLQPENIKEEWQDVVSLHPNLIITCAYGQIIPRELLVYPKYGCINVHASLLPKLRGGAPIHHAIIDGYKTTGVTIMHMNPRMDEGDIIAKKEIEILDTDTAEVLHDKLSLLGRDLLLEVLPSIINKTAPRIPQNNEEATYAKNISKEDEKIDFNKTTRQIYNQIRGLNSWPGAYALFEGKRMKIWASRISNYADPFKINGQIINIYPDGFGVKVSNGEIVITEIQLEGKKKMKTSEFLNGLQDKNSIIGKILE
ncbi:MAG: methionyl-tRNA formyltransferase [Bacilli bacterium]|nr:methionyl-tRNA formyltransferase [Bacilli bacterium]